MENTTECCGLPVGIFGTWNQKHLLKSPEGLEQRGCQQSLCQLWYLLVFCASNPGDSKITFKKKKKKNEMKSHEHFRAKSLISSFHFDLLYLLKNKNILWRPLPLITCTKTSQSKHSHGNWWFYIAHIFPERVIAMSFPSKGLMAMYRNPIEVSSYIQLICWHYR